ncbi:hypothetical protein MSAN_00073800 [Mycena sanguinolenta]|uniref:DUF7918 domain-containing protein n=1 Tax=Mycena sanguinolenta TaxID=230812 RepID=A0A8H6ZFJ5_9AGAR|nr:hypothetical protein MSAN_00073800 [Mycena sanguinolenta]
MAHFLDDDAYLESALHPQLGLIKLEIWRVDVGGGFAPPAIAVPSAQKVHERSKKGMNQQVQFGDAIQHGQVQSAQIRRVGQGPLVTFSFKYRSLDLLRANGIAPQAERTQKRKASSTPEPESTDSGAQEPEEEATKSREQPDAPSSKRSKRYPEPTENSIARNNIKTEPSSSETNLKPE